MKTNLLEFPCSIATIDGNVCQNRCHFWKMRSKCFHTPSPTGSALNRGLAQMLASRNEENFKTIKAHILRHVRLLPDQMGQLCGCAFPHYLLELLLKWRQFRGVFIVLLGANIGLEKINQKILLNLKHSGANFICKFGSIVVAFSQSFLD